MTATNPSLYFSNVSSGWNYNGREGEYYELEAGDDVAFVHAAGQAYILLKLNRFIVFRPQSQTDERDALFLTRQFLDTNRDERSAEIQDAAPQQFASELEAGAIGRVLLYQDDRMNQYQAAYLFFFPDGAGHAIGGYGENWVDFRWDDLTTRAWAELLTEDAESLRPLCAQIFNERLNPRIPNPYIEVDDIENALVNIPHVFERGSEEELRRLTVAIVHSDPVIWNDEAVDKVRVMYRARTPTKRGCLMRVDQGWSGDRSLASGRLHSLCDLAQRLNTFTGVEYKVEAEHPNRRGDYAKEVRQVIFEIPAPSQHERAESLLIVGDWLEGKVRPEKRLRLLGLEAGALS